MADVRPGGGAHHSVDEPGGHKGWYMGQRSASVRITWLQCCPRQGNTVHSPSERLQALLPLLLLLLPVHCVAQRCRHDFHACCLAVLPADPAAAVGAQRPAAAAAGGLLQLPLLVRLVVRAEQGRAEPAAATSAGAAVCLMQSAAKCFGSPLTTANPNP